MKVLVVHNRYQLAGGEDAVVDAEVALLQSRGVDVRRYERHNDDIQHISRASAALQAYWSRQTVSELSDLMAQWQPDVIHVHNTLSLVSPSVYWVADRFGVPVVQTLHNFRLLCPQGMLLRDGQVCEQCVGKSVAWPAVAHACYRESALQSAVLAGLVAGHRALGTYSNKVARFIALNDFCRAKFVQGGLPADKLVVKPNFVDLPAPDQLVDRAGGLFVGRLSHEKGVATLVQAKHSQPALPVKVIGSGPMGDAVQTAFGSDLLGFLPLVDIVEHMRRSAFLVLPSICYENFPRTVVEAFACGLPVIASRMGSMAVLVKEGETGLLFNPGDAQDLVTKIQWAQAHPAEIARMGCQARRQYEEEFNADVNFELLMAIYQDAMAASNGA
ncbi:MAG: hypothetical protein RLZZ369_2367 [Pseudomonadota bacterium]|jgi:glycosyltransferase involved in cell wall biosynthesis